MKNSSPQRSSLADYLEDPLLAELYGVVRAAGPVRVTQVDLTHRCNLRCTGCYFFAEEMDKYRSPKDEAEFDAFMARELARGTTAMLVTGGEPALALGRLGKLRENFQVTCVTNGVIPIPYEGFEDMPVHVSVWGGARTDMRLRGAGKIDTFGRSLDNYRNDPRAVWYYTLTAGNADEIPEVVERIINNGNSVAFNFYGDINGAGGELDHRRGFERCRAQIMAAIERWPARVHITEYILDVILNRSLFGNSWGYESCCALSVDHPANAERLKSGELYTRHLNVYLPDLVTTRRCCTGDARDCDNCFETYTHITWIINHMRAHRHNKADFTRWLTTMYIYLLTGHTPDVDGAERLLPAVHRRLAELRHSEEQPSVGT